MSVAYSESDLLLLSRIRRQRAKGQKAQNCGQCWTGLGLAWAPSC